VNTSFCYVFKCIWVRTCCKVWQNFNVQANILGNYVRDVDICAQLYYSFIDTNWHFEDKFRYPNYVSKSICRFCRANLMLLELLYNYYGGVKTKYMNFGHKLRLLIFYSNTKCPNTNFSYFYDFSCYFMGSNNSRKQVSFQKNCDSQYKKDNHCLPARTQLPTNVIWVH
jgi:hypothetical protein